jgi:hypothetical protein
MSEFDDAMTRLAAAVTRLEAVVAHPQHPADDDRTTALAETVAARLDAALARLGRLLLDREE